MTSYGLLTFEGADELDFTGPWEVFAVSSILRNGVDSLALIAQNKDVVNCQKGMRVLPSHTLDNHPPLDVLVVPGGHGVLHELDNSVLTGWIKRTSADVTWATSVSTGAFLMYASGPMRGRRATTHHAYTRRLESMGDVTVIPNARYVVDGNLVSSQGISAGIDMALWLVGQLHGREHARDVQWRLQYYPAPPYQAEEPF
ncbi:DJ-1/PfpI family protein [Nocardia terpenica]|uniref:DJ-1/PfpI family protein n=1 Tax=Nocardia terpenica TaxID=455432 RepID=A0A6G9YZC9_9NOCA|nr:DJ-1/PfpI family protein [Nocardia terpenica]QIS18471.1 DJ-1/PfpI family protein [Nocardia terpenica]